MAISGGYLLLSRKLIESKIYDKPPLYLKVWVYLLSKAQHKDYKKLDRGQLFTSIPEIQEACSWYVGYRKETPSKSKIYRIIEWLRKTCERVDERDTNDKMIETTKATQGMVVTVLNYGYYQDPKNYDRNGDRTDERTTNATRPKHYRNNINKNVKNDNNDKNDNKEKEEEKIDVPYQKIKELYNQTCSGKLPSIRTISNRRRKHLRARWKEEGNLEVFKELFEKTINCDFLTGNNDRGWKADFDWLIKNQTNFNKVLEGKYDSGSKKSKQNEKDERLARIYQKYKDEEESIDVL